MNIRASSRREDIALVRAFRRSVFFDRARIGAVHRIADEVWLAEDASGRLMGSFSEEKAAVRALLDGARREMAR
jgi:hypothetical protein